MRSIAERKRRKRESAILRQARLDLLAELDQLKDKTCEKCGSVGSRDKGSFYTCDCPAATRMRVIGQELSNLSKTNKSPQVPKRVKEVKKVAKKNNPPEITEEAVNAMKDSGMTYAAIAKHFGVSAPTITNRRQNWELERVRKQHQEGKNAVKLPKSEGVVKDTKAESSAVLLRVDALEDEIEELKEAVLRKDGIIQKQSQMMKLMETELSDLDKHESAKDDQKLLAILLEREVVRIKNLLEVG